MFELEENFEVWENIKLIQGAAEVAQKVLARNVSHKEAHAALNEALTMLNEAMPGMNRFAKKEQYLANVREAPIVMELEEEGVSEEAIEKELQKLRG